jgi:hypothetical protein
MKCTLNEWNGKEWVECENDAVLLELDSIDNKTEYPVCLGHKWPGFKYRRIDENQKKR